MNIIDLNFYNFDIHFEYHKETFSILIQILKIMNCHFRFIYKYWILLTNIYDFDITWFFNDIYLKSISSTEFIIQTPNGCAKWKKMKSNKLVYRRTSIKRSTLSAEKLPTFIWYDIKIQIINIICVWPILLSLLVYLINYNHQLYNYLYDNYAFEYYYFSLFQYFGISIPLSKLNK